ncbi:YkoP family protein [Planifilum fimeticola]
MRFPGTIRVAGSQTRGWPAAWRIWDQIFLIARGSSSGQGKRNLFRFVIKRYRGEPLLTPDGFFLKKGINAKLHLHNCLFARMIRENPTATSSWPCSRSNPFALSFPPWPGLWRIIPGAGDPRPFGDHIPSPGRGAAKSWVCKMILIRCIRTDGSAFGPRVS